MNTKNMPTENDPLRDLIATDTGSVNKEKLACILKDYISFESADGAINFKSPFNNLDSQQKIEIILAAVKAKSLLFSDCVDRVPPSKIIDLDALPAGSVKSALKKLYDERKIKKDNQGYFLPNYRIDDLIGQFNKQ